MTTLDAPVEGHGRAVDEVLGEQVLLVVGIPDRVRMAELYEHLGCGGRAVVVLGAEDADGARVLDEVVPGLSAARPYLRRDRRDARVFTGRGPHDAIAPGSGPLRLDVDDLLALPDRLGTVRLRIGADAVAAEIPVGAGTLVVVGSRHLVADPWLGRADNALALSLVVHGVVPEGLVGRIRRMCPDPTRVHDPVPVVDAGDLGPVVASAPDPGSGEHTWIRAAGHAGRLLPPPLHDALIDLVDDPPAAGALLVRGAPIGAVPATPVDPGAATGKDLVSEHVLLTVARRLGQPVGYRPEHGGRLVQNLVPTVGAVGTQTSTSSGVLLEFHTEAAFHRHVPSHVLLLCLRGDPRAATLLSSVRPALGHLSLGARAVLSEPRFRLGVDESYAGGRVERLGPPMPVLTGPADDPHLCFDADLMVGTDPEAAAVLDELGGVLRRLALAVILEPGDLLVVDNHLAVHGRSPYRARFDGRDRWLQRAFVVGDLASSAAERSGRVITTRYRD